MASKVSRKNEIVFAGAVAPTNVVAQFGSLKAGSPNFSADLDVIQALTAWANGFTDEMIAGYAPAIEDFNAIFSVISQQLAYIMQAGIPEYDAGTTYYIGSICSSSGVLYISLVDSNLGNALTDTTKWVSFYSRKITTINSSYTATAYDWYIRFSGNTPVSAFVYLPTPSAALAGKEIIVKLINNTSTNNLFVAAIGGSTINGNNSLYYAVPSCNAYVCSGTNWETLQGI